MIENYIILFFCVLLVSSNETNSCDNQNSECKIDTQQQFQYHRTVARLHNPTIHAFIDYVDRNEPVIITGAMTKWIQDDWSDENMLRLCGHRSISVRTMVGGNVFQRGEYTIEKMTLRDFIENYDKTEVKQDDKPEEASKYYYAAGIVLEKDLPELMKYVHEPKYLKRYPQANDKSPRMYFGKGGPRLHIHFDAIENLLHVIEGSKEIILFDPFQSRTVLYLPNPKETPGNYNWSPIDMEDSYTWKDKYPLFKYSLPTKCVVRAGEILYLPPYWFHSVESDYNRSVSVNFWYTGDKQKFKFLEDIVYGLNTKNDVQSNNLNTGE